jgi:Delta7-sterol 5-desaturase
VEQKEWSYEPSTQFFSIEPSHWAYESSLPRDNGWRQLATLFTITLCVFAYS